MLAMLLAISAHFVTLHGGGGQPYYINPAQITSMREPVGNDLRHFPARTHCVITTTSGKFVAVQETCNTVRDIVSAPH